MIDNRTVKYGALLMRLLTGIYFLVHVGIKIFVFTPAGTAGYFGSLERDEFGLNRIRIPESGLF